MNPKSPDIEAIVTFLRTDEGGRKSPVLSGYRGQFYYDGKDCDADEFYPGVAQVNPGETVTARLAFANPQLHVGRVQIGTEFLIREGGKTVGRGIVTKILNFQRNAEDARIKEGSFLAASPHPNPLPRGEGTSCP